MLSRSALRRLAISPPAYDISVVIPFHNEEVALGRLIPELAAVISAQTHSFEVLLVDDVSNDASVDVVEGLRAALPAIQLLRLQQRGGQSGAMKRGFAQARGSYIIRMDGDGQDDPADIPRFLERLDGGAELVMGVRAHRQHSLAARFLSRSFDLLPRLLLRSPLRTHSGSFVAFKRPLVQNFPWMPNDHRYLPLIALRRGAREACELEVNHRPRHGGQSKYHMGMKALRGGPEVLAFFTRLLRGHYDVPTERSAGCA